jgi:hypothetical protein
MNGQLHAPAALSPSKVALLTSRLGDSTTSFEPVDNRDEVTGKWRKLHNEEVHDLYSSPSIIRIIKSRRMRWAGHVARMGRRGTLIDYWWESQRERYH